MTARSVTVRLSASVSDYMAKMTAAGRATEDLARKVQVAKGQTAAGYRMIGTAAVAGGGLVVAGFAAAAKAAANFDQRMALVRTLSKASEADMGRLRNAALNVGQAYGYSADDVADAEAELVKAGVSIKDILGGALIGSLTLASAGQTDVAEATEVAASAMVQFGLAGKDIPHLADLLAAGADKALGSVGDLGYGLSQVGTTAHQFGISVDETVGTLSALANAGQIGEKGGTELNQMLLRLSGGSHQATEEMDHLGITAYDAQGNFVGLANFAGQLHDKLGPLTQAERTHAETVIFGSRAIKAANVLYAEGADGITNWTQKVNDAGFAQLQAAGKLDSLTGDWLKFKAAMTNALIGTGEQAQGPLRELIQDATDLVDFWNKLPGPVKDAAEAFTLAAGAVTLVGGAALLAVPKVAELNAALAASGRSTITMRGALGSLGKAGIVGATLYGVYEGAKALGQAFDQDAQPSVEKLTQTMYGLASGTSAASDGWLKQIGAMEHAMKAAGGLGDSLSNTDQALANMVTSGHLEEAQTAYDRLTGELKDAGYSSEDILKAFPLLATALNDSATSAAAAGNGVDQYGNALTAAAKASQAATKNAKKYNDALTAASDPIFGLNQALQDLASKQNAATKASNKYGADSKQARQANLDLAQSMVAAQGAASTLAAAVRGGHVSMANAKSMVDAFTKSMGLTKPQARAILREFHDLIGTSRTLNQQKPVITVRANTSQASSALAALMAQTGAADRSLDQMSLHAPHIPGHKAGGGVADGLFTVGEQGPELGFKSGSRVDIFSNKDSRRMVAGMGVPGFAGGTVSGRGVERRLDRIMGNPGSTPHEIARAADALQDLSDAWDRTLKHIANEQQIRELKRAVQQASSPSELASAEHQLAQFRRQRQQDHRTDEIQRAQTRLQHREDVASRRRDSKQQLRANKEQWQFENMNAQQQVAFLDKKIAKEKKYTDQWLSDMEQRKSLLDGMTAGGSSATAVVNYPPNQPISIPDIGSRYATGGPVAGPGSGTSDSIYARLSNGEYVEPAGVAARYRPALDAMRAGTYVPAQTSGGDMHVHVHTGPIYGADQRAVRNLAQQLAGPIQAELRKRQTNRGPLGLS